MSSRAPSPVPRLPARKDLLRLRDFEWAGALPILAVHAGAVAGILLGGPWPVWVTCIALYWLRMFGVTAGYHRYFSHRSFKTSRWFQFALAFLAETSSQKGALWWAAHHRVHHRVSDTEADVHSPRRSGFLYAHVGWIYHHTGDTDYSKVRDFARYPELVWLNRWWVVPPTVLGALCFLAQGWPGLLIGFMLSTVLCWHATFTVNSLTHMWGSRRYETDDDSRNNLWIALLTMGEGWHNNHHHYASCTRQGFFWWEIDVTWYLLKLLSWVRLVWDLRPPPPRVYAEARAAAGHRPAA